MALKKTYRVSKFLLVLLTLSHGEEDERCSIQVPSENGAKSCMPYEAFQFNEDSPSWFVMEPFGRFGNHFTAYAHLYEMRKQLGVQVYIMNETRAYLEKVFDPEKLRLPVIEDEICDIDNVPFRVFDIDVEHLLTDESFWKGHILLLFDKQVDHLKLNVPSQPYKFFIAGMVKSMRRSLKVRKDILERVQTKMAEIEGKFRKKHPEVDPEQAITWVGIHNRRSDFISHSWTKHRATPVEEEFFVEAMEDYRKRFGTAVIFLFVSDDMKWGRQNLMNPKKDLFFVGTGKTSSDDDIAFDMTTLVQCNHSIFTQGSFGQWASLLAAYPGSPKWGPHYSSNWSNRTQFTVRTKVTMAAVSQKAIIYGGRGGLGTVLVTHFKSKGWWVCSIDLQANEEANENVLVDPKIDWMSQEALVTGEVQKKLGEDKVDAIINMAGGWAGGAADSKDFIKNCDLMWKQSVWSSAISASLASKHLKDGGLILLPGAKPALEGTPGMIGYGMAKAAIHQLIKSLACEKSGLPAGSSALGLLPITLDTPMNRKWMPDADHTTWTRLDYVAELALKWSSGVDRPSSGNLVQLVTKGGATTLICEILGWMTSSPVFGSFSQASIRSEAYMARLWGDRAIPLGGDLDTAASNTCLSMAWIEVSTDFQDTPGFCASKSLMKSWQNICNN
eukprot:maker-scaffold702_size109376-snap-gene-0.22 protein:Tk12096 transcript:maker-scaffold702_size109376-snap-gene-0.22-mRNA-1 annotation:"dihydropteridine reductase"